MFCFVSVAYTCHIDAPFQNSVFPSGLYRFLNDNLPLSPPFLRKNFPLRHPNQNGILGHCKYSNLSEAAVNCQKRISGIHQP